MASVVLSSGGFGRPIMAPPGMPAEIARAIRDGFAKMLKDPEFIAEVKKRRYDLEPISWDEMQSLAREMTSQPPEVVDWVKRILEN